MERTVEVWGKRVSVTVHQLSKSVWEAVGEYMGEVIRTKDRSESTALKRWQEAAKYKGGWAGIDVTEYDRDGLRTEKHRPFPSGRMRS